MTCLDDATVLGLVDGRLAPTVIADVDRHLDACASCRDVVTVVARARRTTPVLARGHALERYVIGELLGTGAMGRVYSAWEPELDRRVAIKVLHDDTSSRDRLVHEAKAMARLTHPNVVTVHEVGTTDDGVFVAMELVDGETLRAWAERRHPWRELARVLIEIARGLAAVHLAGVIHRDLKPDNVIVGRDGRVRIGDFGLARSSPTAEPRAASAELALATSRAGTPAYMAPEVLRGAAADPRSDQFSFGVTAYEVVSGHRPYDVRSGGSSELLAAIQAGPPDRLLRVPAWLDATIRRCLATDPARRFESLAVVAETLSRGLARRRRAPWIAGAVASAAVASGATWFAVRAHPAGSCASGQRELAAIWTPEARARLANSLAADAVDRWSHGWIDTRDATCRAIDSEPAPRIAARERCLDQRRDELAALVERASSRTADRVIDVLASLSPPIECATADAGTADPLPLDPVRAAAARTIAARLPSVRVLIGLGDPGSVGESTALVATANECGHAPTLAEALIANADALRGAGRLDDAASAARDAVAAAERGHADSAAATAWIARVAVASDRRELAVADDLGTLAAAAIERAGSAPHLVATLERWRGLVAYNRGRLDDARTLLLDARQRFAALDGETSFEVAGADSALGSVARAAGDLDQATARHRSALEIDRRLRGQNHPDVARDLHNLAGVYRLRGALDQALATYREALAVDIAIGGDHGVAAGLTHNSIALVLMARAEWQAAEIELTLARDLLDAAGHGDRAFAEHNLGLVAQATGDHRAAIVHFTRAAEIYGGTIGDAAASPIRLALDRARSELALGDPAAARRDATLAHTAAVTAKIDWIASDATVFLDEVSKTRRVEARPQPVHIQPAVAVPPPAPVAAPVVVVDPQPPAPQPKRDVGAYGAALPR